MPVILYFEGEPFVRVEILPERLEPDLRHVLVEGVVKDRVAPTFGASR
jgi:hypothetical protein